MGWREKIATMTPEEKERALDEMAAEDDAFEAMTDEQQTLHLARLGHSPEDLRCQVDRAMALFRRHLTEARQLDRDVERWTAEGGH
jgi:hypothetical protein